MKRKAISFRPKQLTVEILDDLVEEMETSKTKVIEIAIHSLSKMKDGMGRAEHPLTKFAGMLSKKEGKEMRNLIYKNRKNRKSSLI
jgi:hypothetical protein